eukprot:Selendium_serpulae@DN5505_c0_g1_i1.p2
MLPEQMEDIRAMTNHVSHMTLKARIEVEGEESMVEGDFATCVINMTRTNLAEGEAAGAVHAPLFPGVKFEEWMCMLLDKNSGMIQGQPMRIKCNEKETEERIKFQLNSGSGIRNYILRVMCDSYLGLDHVEELTARVYSMSERPRVEEEHEGDRELDEQPGFWQMMTGAADEEEEEESGGEE